MEFNNVRFLSTMMSNWGLATLCEKHINTHMRSRAEIARALVTHHPVNVSALTLTESQIVERLATTQNYCPVALKQRLYRPQPLRSEHLLYFDNQLYLCGSDADEQAFRAHPTNYLASVAKLSVPVPAPLARLERGGIVELQGKCPVALTQGRLENGFSHLLVQHKKQWFAFGSTSSLREFETDPKKFKGAHLPDKIPLVFEKNKVRM